MRHPRLCRRQGNGLGRAGVRGSCRGTLVTLFLLLLAVLQVSGPLATIDIVWRTMVVSFDNPETQVLDQIALEKPSFGDVSRDMAGISRVTATAPSGTTFVAAPRRARLFLQGHFTDRSPPIT